MRTLLRTARHWAEYLGFRLVTGMVAALPVEKAADVSAALWTRAAPLTRRHARALRHLRAAHPSLPEAELEALARAMWGHLGRTFAEALHLHRIAFDRARMRPFEEGAARDLLRAPGGKVFVSLHQGNWELAAGLAVREGLSPAGVYQQVQNPLIDRWLVAHRESLYPSGLFTKGAETPRRVLRLLRDGGTVCLMADLREIRGVEVPFLGRLAPSTTFPAMAARTTNATLIAAQVRRQPGTKFTVELVEIPVARTSDREADIFATTAAIQRQFETWIRQAPEQWMWAHKRWGRSPDLPPRIADAPVPSGGAAADGPTERRGGPLNASLNAGKRS